VKHSFLEVFSYLCTLWRGDFWEGTDRIVVEGLTLILSQWNGDPKPLQILVEFFKKKDNNETIRSYHYKFDSEAK